MAISIIVRKNSHKEWAFMNKRFLNVGAALSVFLLASCFFVGCGDDGSSASNVEDAVSSSSSVENLSQSGDALSSSDALSGPSSADALAGPSSAESSSSAVESSAAVTKPSQLCKINMVTQTGFPNVAVISAFTSICLPLENCDTSAVNTGYDRCYEGLATEEGCYSSMNAEVVESCDDVSDEPACEIPNGPVYIKGRFKVDCSHILR